MIFLNLFFGNSLEFSVGNATSFLNASLGIPSNAVRDNSFCARCKNDKSNSFFGDEARQGYQKSSSGLGAVRSVDKVFLIIQQNSTHMDTEHPAADGSFKSYTKLYASQHYAEVDKYTVLRTEAQQPYGKIAVAIYTWNYALKRSVQYQVPFQNWFSNLTATTDDIYVQSNRTIALKYKKGILTSMYWQSQVIKCNAAISKHCIDNQFNGIKCNKDGDGNLLCPIFVNVVFEGTDGNGALMESVGFFFLLRIF
eukprot:NODE_4_length_55019_cov_0.425091.p25 type:complete len:253 gc:universal NODE_4_length_55019_cov_0.425091:43964-44722(+)